MKKLNLILGIVCLLVTTLVCSCITTTGASASSGTYTYNYYTKTQARETINQTSYVINQAYEISRFYSYWTDNRLAKAMYYNDYAQRLFSYGKYNSSINYSLLAREYALDVIDGCDDYWEYFYFTNFGWSHRYGYNKNFAYRNGYRDGYYDGYYAAYCARYSHDYRSDPYLNLKPEWYSNDRYKQVVYNTSNQSARHQSHTVGTTSGGRTTGYRNINSGDYYTKEESAMSDKIPSLSDMENEFKKENPKVSLSNESMQKDELVLKRNLQNSTEYSSNTKTKERNTQIETPKRINSSANEDTKRQVSGSNAANSNTRNSVNTSTPNTRTAVNSNSESKSNTRVNNNSNSQVQKSVDNSKTRNTVSNSSVTTQKNNNSSVSTKTRTEKTSNNSSQTKTRNTATSSEKSVKSNPTSVSTNRNSGVSSQRNRSNTSTEQTKSQSSNTSRRR